MKKLLPTLLLVVVLIGGYAYAKHENFFREKTKPAATLFTVPSTDVTSLKIVNGEGTDNTVEVLKKDDAWQMQSPAAYPVEKLSVDSAVQFLADLKVKSVIDEHPGSLADFGLEKPVREADATLKDGSVKKLLVGNPLPVAGTTYVKTSDSDTVYEVQDTELQGVFKKPEDLLDKSVVKLDYDKVKSVDLEWKGQKWTLTKSDLSKKAYESAWKVGDKELKPEEGSKVLDKLVMLSTDRLPQKRTDVNWNGAELKVTVHQDDNGQDTVLTYLGKVDNQVVRVAKDDGTWAYAVSSDDIQALYDAPTTVTAAAANAADGSGGSGDAASASPGAGAAAGASPDSSASSAAGK